MCYCNGSHNVDDVMRTDKSHLKTLFFSIWFLYCKLGTKLGKGYVLCMVALTLTCTVVKSLIGIRGCFLLNKLVVTI